MRCCYTKESKMMSAQQSYQNKKTIDDCRFYRTDIHCHSADGISKWYSFCIIYIMELSVLIPYMLTLKLKTKLPSDLDTIQV